MSITPRTKVLVHFRMDGEQHPFTAMMFLKTTPLSIVRQQLYDHQLQSGGRLVGRDWVFKGLDMSLVVELEAEMASVQAQVAEYEASVVEQNAWRQKNPHDPHLMSAGDFFEFQKKIGQQKAHIANLHQHIVNVRHKAEGFRLLETMFIRTPKKPPRGEFMEPYSVVRPTQRSGKSAPSFSDIGLLINPLAKVLLRSPVTSPKANSQDSEGEQRVRPLRTGISLFKFASKAIIQDLRRQRSAEEAEEKEAEDHYLVALVTLVFRDETSENLRLASESDALMSCVQPTKDSSAAFDSAKIVLNMVRTRHDLLLNLQSSFLGWSALHSAVACHCGPDTVRLLVLKGAKAELKDSRGWTPWHYAAYRKDYDCLSIFTAHHLPGLCSRDFRGRTPMHMALERGDKKVVRLLLQHGGLQPHVPCPSNFAEDRTWELLLGLMSPMHAIEVDDDEEMRFLIRALEWKDLEAEDIGLKLRLLDYTVVHDAQRCARALIHMGAKVCATTLTLGVKMQRFDLVNNVLLPSAPLTTLSDNDVSAILHAALTARTHCVIALDKVVRSLFERLAPSSVPLAVVGMCMLQRTESTVGVIMTRLQYASQATLEKLASLRDKEGDTILGCAIRSEFVYGVTQLISFTGTKQLACKLVSLDRLPLLFAVEKEVHKSTYDVANQRPFSEYRLHRCIARLLLQDEEICSSTINVASGPEGHKRAPIEVSVAAANWHITCMLLSFGARVAPHEKLLSKATLSSVALVQIVLANAGQPIQDELTLTTLLEGSATKNKPEILQGIVKMSPVDFCSEMGHRLLRIACQNDSICVAVWLMEQRAPSFLEAFSPPAAVCVSPQGRTTHHRRHYVSLDRLTCLSARELRRKVQQGICKGQQCGNCKNRFFVSELPGFTTLKAILERQQKLGCSLRFPSEFFLKQVRPLCSFCIHFFSPPKPPPAPTGVEHTTLQIVLQKVVQKGSDTQCVERERLCWSLLRSGCPPGVTTLTMDSGILLSLFAGMLEMTAYFILTLGLDPNERCRKYRRSVLHWCVKKRHYNLLRSLINEGRAAVDTLDDMGHTPLQDAVLARDFQSCVLLLASGRITTPPKVSPYVGSILIPSYVPPLFASDEAALTKIKDPSLLVNTLISQSFDIQTKTYPANATDLLWRVLAWPPLVQALHDFLPLDLLTSTVGVEGGNGMKVTHRAAARGYITTLRILAEAGHDLRQVRTETTHDSVFSLLLRRGLDELALELEPKCGTHERVPLVSVQYNNQTSNLLDVPPLVILLSQLQTESHLNSFKAFLSKGYAVSGFFQDSRSCKITALHVLLGTGSWVTESSRRVREDAVCILLPQHAASEGCLQLKDMLGCTILEWACRRRAVRTLYALLETGQCDVQAPFSSTPRLFPQTRQLDGYTAAHAVVILFEDDVGARLTAAMAASNPWTVVAGKQKRTPLHLAVAFGHQKTFTEMMAQDAPFDTFDNDRMTPLLVACRKGALHCVTALIDAGASLEVIDNKHFTVFAHAAVSGNIDVLRALLVPLDPGVVHHLLKHKCQYRPSYKLSPVEIALLQGHDAFARMLLAKLPKGDLINRVDGPGRDSLLHLAARSGAMRVMEYLLQELSQAPTDMHVLNSNEMSALDVARAMWPEAHPMVTLLEGIEGMPTQSWLDTRSKDTDIVSMRSNAKFLYQWGSWDAVKKMQLRGRDVSRSVTQVATAEAELGHDKAVLNELQKGQDDWKKVFVYNLPSFAYYKKNLENPEIEQINDIEKYRNSLRGAVRRLFSAYGGVKRSDHTDDHAIVQLLLEENVEAVLRWTHEENIIFYTHSIMTRRPDALGPRYREDAEDGKTSLLHILCRTNCYRSMAYILANNTVNGDVRKLVRDMLCVHRDEHGYTPLHYACAMGHTAIVCTVLRTGLELNQPDTKGSLAPMAYLPNRAMALCVQRSAMYGVTYDVPRLANGSEVARATESSLESRVIHRSSDFCGSSPWLPARDDEQRAWAISMELTPGRLDSDDHAALFLQKTAYELFTIPHDKDDVQTSLMVRYTRDIFAENITASVAQGIADIKAFGVELLDRLRAQNVANPPSHMETMLRTHIHEVFDLKVDLASAEMRTSPGEVARAKSLFGYTLPGGVLGRELKDLFLTFALRFGSYGQMCLLGIHGLTIRVAATEKHAKLHLDDQSGCAVFLTWDIFPCPRALVGDAMIPPLLKYFMVQEVFLFRSLLRRIEALDTPNRYWFKRMKVYIVDKVAMMLDSVWRCVRAGGVRDLLEKLSFLRQKSGDDHRVRVFLAMLLGAFDNLEDEGQPHYQRGRVICALQPWKEYLNNLECLHVVFCPKQKDSRNEEKEPMDLAVPLCTYESLALLSNESLMAARRNPVSEEKQVVCYVEYQRVSSEKVEILRCIVSRYSAADLRRLRAHRVQLKEADEEEPIMSE